jgi:hypothetical protein
MGEIVINILALFGAMIFIAFLLGGKPIENDFGGY